MFESPIPLRLSLLVVTLGWASACELQQDGMAIVDAGKGERAWDAMPVQPDAPVLRDVIAAQERAEKPDPCDSPVLDAPSRSGMDVSSPDSVPVLPAPDAAWGRVDTTEIQEQPVDSLPAIIPDAASEALGQVADALANDHSGSEEVPDGALSDASDTPLPVLSPIYLWQLDNTASLGNLPLRQVGKPTILDPGTGPSVCFDGKNDGLIRTSSPLTGLKQFTLQLFIRSDQDDLQERHLLHMEEPENKLHRFIVETRSIKAGTWYPRVFVRWDNQAIEIDNPMISFPSGAWHWMAYSYDGTKARLFVDGVETASKETTWGPMGDAPLSLGMRLNQHGFFPGCMSQIIVSDTALSPSELRIP